MVFMRKYVLSPTKLNLYGECKRCFWLENNAGIKRPQGIFPSLPRGMDSVIKKYFDSYRNQGTVPPELEGIGLRLFPDQASLDVWRSMFRGIRWTDQAGNVLRGSPDEVLEGPKFVILDYKTRGSSPKPNSCTFYQLQLDAYTFLLTMNGKSVENYAYLLFYFPNKVIGKGEFVFDTELVKVEVDPNHAEQVFRDAIRCLQGPIPDNCCDYCKSVSKVWS